MIMQFFLSLFYEIVLHSTLKMNQKTLIDILQKFERFT